MTCHIDGRVVLPMHALWSLTRRRILKVLADVSLKGGFVAKTKIPMTRAATLNVHVRQLMVLRVYARETIGEHLKVLMFDNECANRKISRCQAEHRYTTKLESWHKRPRNTSQLIQ